MVVLDCIPAFAGAQSSSTVRVVHLVTNKGFLAKYNQFVEEGKYLWLMKESEEESKTT